MENTGVFSFLMVLGTPVGGFGSIHSWGLGLGYQGGVHTLVCSEKATNRAAKQTSIGGCQEGRGEFFIRYRVVFFEFLYTKGVRTVQMGARAPLGVVSRKKKKRMK